jgi:hypothetical protein
MLQSADVAAALCLRSPEASNPGSGKQDVFRVLRFIWDATVGYDVAGICDAPLENAHRAAARKAARRKRDAGSTPVRPAEAKILQRLFEHS